MRGGKAARVHCTYGDDEHKVFFFFLSQKDPGFHSTQVNHHRIDNIKDTMLISNTWG